MPPEWANPPAPTPPSKHGSATQILTVYKYIMNLHAQAVRAIGRCAVKLDVAAERCINVLVELIKGRVSYVVQEAVVVVRDIFRKYPNRRAPPCGGSSKPCTVVQEAAVVGVVTSSERLDSCRVSFPPSTPCTLDPAFRLLPGPAALHKCDLARGILVVVYENLQHLAECLVGACSLPNHASVGC